jgi:multicomponent K+:H+ antiporter subunit A
VVCLVVGVMPELTVGPLLAVAAQAALYGTPGLALPEYQLALWHGVNLPLAMSVIALVAGLLLYFGLQRFINLHRLVDLPLWIKRGGRDFFAAGAERTVIGARALTDWLQSGELQRYLALLVMMALVAGALPLLRGESYGPAAVEHARPGLGLIALALIGMAAATATVVMHRQRLLALILLGATGLVVSLLFVYLSAPDLALTQLLVEVVTIVLMMLALQWLPREGPAEGAPFRRNPRKWRDAALAAAAGLGTAALVYMVLTRPFDSISPYFLRSAVSEGGGANAVNVIIVDFRGFDTLGEITVLGIAGVLVFALLAGFRPRLAPAPGGDSERHPLLLALVSRLLLPLAVLVSIYLFLRGHNQPGGGFIAGLVLAIALILLYVGNGGQWVAARMRTDFRGWIGAGLLIAGLCGVASWLYGSPFLTSTYAYPNIWPFGPVPLASASVFDLGVYLTVVGGTMVVLGSLARLTQPGVAASDTVSDPAGGPPPDEAVQAAAGEPR